MITRDDIRLYRAQVNNDEDNGGGSMSGDEVVDGVVNNLFPDVSRIDTTNGDVAMRKVFPAVITENTDVYYGAHTIIRKNPDDERVAVIMVDTKDPHDRRSEAQSKSEAALTFSYEAQFYLFGAHIAGMRALTFMGTLSTEAPPLGDAFYITDGQNSQYVRIVDVETREVTMSYSSGGGNFVDYQRKLFICEITAPLDSDFDGSAFYPGGNQSAVHTYHTTDANAVKYHGTKTLTQDWTTDSAILQLDSIYNQLVPASLRQDALVDQQGPRDLPVLISSMPDKYDGNASGIETTGQIVSNFAFEFTNANGQQWTIDLGSPIEPGSVDIGGSLEVNGYIEHGTVITGVIDHVNGYIHLKRNSSGTSSGSFSISFTRAASALVAARFTTAIDINSGNNGLVHIQNIHPIPSPGSLRVEYRSGGKWYEIAMNTLTTLGIDSDIGVGSINYNGDGSASVSVTLGAEPDINSKIIFTWAHAEGAEARELLPDKSYKVQLPINAGERVQRARITITGSYYGVVYEWNGAGFDLISGSGTLVGQIDPDTGLIIITELISSIGGRLISGDFSVDYDVIPTDSNTITETPDGSGVVTLDIGTIVASGDFEIQYPVSIDVNRSPTETVTRSAIFTVDQSGLLKRVSGAGVSKSDLFATAQLTTFSVDSAAGTVTFHPTNGLSPNEKTYKGVTYTTTSNTVKKSYTKSAVKWYGNI
jgi:hypothetical protein